MFNILMALDKTKFQADIFFLLLLIICNREQWEISKKIILEITLLKNNNFSVK